MSVWTFLIGVAVGMVLGGIADALDYGGRWRKPVADVWCNWRNKRRAIAPDPTQDKEPPR